MAGGVRFGAGQQASWQGGLGLWLAVAPCLWLGCLAAGVDPHASWLSCHPHASWLSCALT